MKIRFDTEPEAKGNSEMELGLKPDHTKRQQSFESSKWHTAKNDQYLTSP